jgi:hypothetical protein
MRIKRFSPGVSMLVYQNNAILIPCRPSCDA